jgi:hypothetical protein
MMAWALVAASAFKPRRGVRSKRCQRLGLGPNDRPDKDHRPETRSLRRHPTGGGSQLCPETRTSAPSVTSSSHRRYRI